MTKKKTASKKAAKSIETETETAALSPRAAARETRKRSVLERKPKLKCLRHREAAGQE